MLKNYMTKLTCLVEQKIIEAYSDKFSMILDCWSCNTIHYVALFASFPFENGKSCQTDLLGFSQLEDETTQNADDYELFIDFVSGVFTKTPGNIVALISDNCNTSISITSKLDVVFIGCFFSSL